jgi:hypothetical protein
LIVRVCPRLDELLGQMQQFSRQLNSREGSLGQLMYNPQLYQYLNEAATNIKDLSRQLQPILNDARAFSDKIARHPELLGVHGALQTVEAPPPDDRDVEEGQAARSSDSADESFGKLRPASGTQSTSFGSIISVTKLPFKMMRSAPARTAKSVIQRIDSIWTRRISEYWPNRASISSSVAR